MIVVDVILAAAAGVLAVPTAVLTAEVAASLLPVRRKSSPAPSADRPAIAVVVPAHNEQATLAETLTVIRSQLQPGDRLVVVADNCTDLTADVAHAGGAECVVRHDEQRRGKGFALAAGVAHLAANTPPAVVLFCDADTHMQPGAIDALARCALETNRPAQATYLLDVPDPPRSRDQVSRFAFVLKNKVRPLGLWKLGLPVPLFGSGMAFPWEVINCAPLATPHLVEDMRLGLDLTLDGHAPVFCPTAEVGGALPADQTDASHQRRRWEHGHLNVISSMPLYVIKAIGRGRGHALVMALDHLVQPILILAGLLGVMLVVGLIALAFGAASWAAWISGVSLLLLSLSIIAAWAGHLRDEIPAKALLGLPGYVMTRVPNQFGYLFRRQRDWVRTPREQERVTRAAQNGSSSDRTGSRPDERAARTALADLPTNPPLRSEARSEPLVTAVRD